jgi:F420-0:gamma-glutamyl ligase
MGHSTDWYNKMRKAAAAGSKKAAAHIATKKGKDKDVNARKEQIKKRVESKRKGVEYKKKNGHKPASKGLDYDHATNSYVAVAINRGRKGEGNRKKGKRT